MPAVENTVMRPKNHTQFKFSHLAKLTQLEITVNPFQQEEDNTTRKQ
jgi:hypothetical protein